VKILQVIDFFTPSRGGSVIVPYNISKQLAKNGHDVTILTTDFEFDKDFAKSLEQVTVIPFNCKANLSLFLYSPEMKNWLKNNIENFDLIHLHNFRSYQNMIASKYSKKNNVPYILQAHGSLPYNGKTILKKTYDTFYGYNILRSASKCIALTETEKQQYMQMGVSEEKIEIIPNGINISEYENLPERGIFRKKNNMTEQEKIILFLGRIHWIKGLDLLVDAFADLIKEVDNTKVVIVGPDDGFLSTLKEQIKTLNIEDKVIFTGPLFLNDKLSAYVDADVYILPSRYETFPNTVLEAWACGVPVIATKECGISDLISKSGYIVNFDKIELSNKIRNILMNSDICEQFKNNGREMIEKELNLYEIGAPPL
jgi:glycosyltransferase involved in cell wall biosynthesis